MAVTFGLWLIAAPAFADVRVALFVAPFTRDGPGLLLRDIDRGDTDQISAAIAVISHIAPDILVLSDFDFDAGGAALQSLAARIAQTGPTYPYWFSRMPNSGRQSGFDVNGDGYLGDAVDAWGYGRFLGQGGVAILSRFPIAESEVRDLSDLIWQDLPGATLPETDGAPFYSADIRARMPLSSTVHWIVPVTTPDDGTISLLVHHATTPVFDGPEDRNGLRNRDENRLWPMVLEGVFGPPPVNAVIVANTNLDPADGDGRSDHMASLLARSDLIDPLPSSAGGLAAANPDHVGDPALDTVDWPNDGPGNLRVSYVLPTTVWKVTGAGVFWPAPDDPLAQVLGADGLAAGAHRLVWVDLRR